MCVQYRMIIIVCTKAIVNFPFFIFGFLKVLFYILRDFSRRDFLFLRVFMGLTPAESARTYPPPPVLSWLLLPVILRLLKMKKLR